MATQMQRRALPNALLVILLIIDRVSSSSCPDLFDTWTPRESYEFINVSEVKEDVLPHKLLY